MSALLSVEDLSVAFGGRSVVEGVTLSVARGETVALVGESGSGKSVTAMAVMGLIAREGGQVTGGRILLDGTDLVPLPASAIRRVRGGRIGMIFQEPMTALNPVLTLGEQVAEVLRLHRGLDRGAARAATIESFARVRLTEPERRFDQFPHELSGGMRQRVMIAAALAGRPDLLVADEPTTALDVTTQAEVLSLLRELQTESGMGMLFITHDMGVVREIADRMVVMKDGRVVESGAVAHVGRAPQAAYTRRLLAASPRLGEGSPRPPAPAPAVLDARNLHVSYQGGHGARRTVVRGVDLSIMRGETLGLVGESGCGKSSLARALLRLIPSDAGRISLMGSDITDLSQRALRPLRRHMQIVAQDPNASLNPRMRVVDLITEPAVLHRRLPRAGRRELAAGLLARVGLPEDALDRWPHQFSGGQRQRLCIARALSARPDLVVADEAVSALDVSVARQVTDLMRDLQNEAGFAYLFISHDLAVVERVSHRIAVMRAGRIVELGPTQAVLTRPRHPYTARLLAAVPGTARGAARWMAEPAPDLPLIAVGPGHFAAVPGGDFGWTAEAPEASRPGQETPRSPTVPADPRGAVHG